MKHLKWYKLAIGAFVLCLQAIASEWIAPLEAASAQYQNCIETSSVAISTPDSQDNAANTNQLPSKIFQKWRHSFEEDTKDITVYRPFDHTFPPARGRAGIEFRADGEFIDWAIAPTDRLECIPGQWRMEKNGRIRVDFENDTNESRILEIVEYSTDVLKIRKMPASKSSTTLNEDK